LIICQRDVNRIWRHRAVLAGSWQSWAAPPSSRHRGWRPLGAGLRFAMCAYGPRAVGCLPREETG